MQTYRIFQTIYFARQVIVFTISHLLVPFILDQTLVLAISKSLKLVVEQLARGVLKANARFIQTRFEILVSGAFFYQARTVVFGGSILASGAFVITTGHGTTFPL